MPVILLKQAKKTFVIVVFVTTIIKLWLALCFPITSDEAFFFVWAQFPNWGYYDHPPMIGWWLWVLRHLGDSPLVIRSATVVLTTAIAYGVVRLSQQCLPEHESPRAWLAGAVYLSMPVSWAAVLVTTDTPLILFMGLSIYAYVTALKRESLWGMGWAGVFLGLAFLSKYFAVLLGLAYAVDLLLIRRRVRSLLVLLLGCLPFVAENLVYNAYNCWNNVMFNLINRHAGAQLGWLYVLLYVAMVVYVLTPWVGFRLLKNVSAWGQHAGMWMILLVPLGVFFFISAWKLIGLHWVLGFIPMAFVLLALWTPSEVLQRYVRWNAMLSVPHLLAVGVLLHGSVSIWHDNTFQQDVTFHREAQTIVQVLNQNMPEGGVLTTVAYSPAALMSYYLGRVVPVFGSGKYHARNDDVFVDWRRYDGQFVRIVSKAKPIDPSVYQDYFERVTVRTLMVQGIPFTVVDGEHFKYAKFRDVVLREAVERYYQIPSMLPVLDCPFARKYGFERACGVASHG